MKFPIDSCIWEYWDWTTNCDDRTSPDKHFVWLSNKFTSFQTDLGTPYMLPDFSLGLPAIEDWPKWTRDILWILDPTKHPRPAVQSHHESTGLSSGDERRRKRKKKKHRRPKKQELKVTTRDQGDDVPIWSHTGSNLSLSSESQIEGDSGISSYRKPRNDAGSTSRHDHTPRYSPDTIKRLEEGDLEDAPSATTVGTVTGTKRW